MCRFSLKPCPSKGPGGLLQPRGLGMATAGPTGPGPLGDAAGPNCFFWEVGLASSVGFSRYLLGRLSRIKSHVF